MTALFYSHGRILAVKNFPDILSHKVANVCHVSCCSIICNGEGRKTPLADNRNLDNPQKKNTKSLQNTHDTFEMRLCGQANDCCNTRNR